MTDSDSNKNEVAASINDLPKWRREMEAKANANSERADAAEAKLQAYERNDLFRSAGLDPSSKRDQMLIKSYEGEMSVEAIRMEATAVGFLGQESSEMSSHQAETLSAEQRIAASSEGGEPYVSPDFEQRMLQTNNLEELRALWEGEGHLWGAAV
tara:strand:- start:31 stop:495 length:465 start_codon:yes stop_codon:yes gene_type:complete